MSTQAPATLYRGRGCGSAMVEAAFALAGQPLRRIDASRWDGAAALAELERINPLGQVPTLIWPEGSVQTESAAILIEADRRWPSAGLFPAQPAARSQALRWLVYLVSNVYPHYTMRDFPERWTDEPAVQSLLVDGAKARIRDAWLLMAGQMPVHGPFVFGAGPGALDIAIAVISRWTPGRSWFDPACPQLAAVAHAVDGHPLLQPVWADNFPDKASPGAQPK